MQFGKSFSFMFKDENWITKFFLAVVISLIPVIGQVTVLGWTVEITRRVIHGDEEVLPDWGGFVDYLIHGLVAMLIGFVYMLPFILFQICGGSIMAFTQESGGDAATLGMIAGICVTTIAIIYAVLVGFLIMAAIGIYADTGEIGAAFRIGEAFKLVKAAPVAYLLVFLGAMLAGLIASLGIILCFIGIFVTTVFAQIITAHLEGQAYREAKLNMGDDNLLPDSAL